MEIIYEKCCGVDVHQKNIVVCMMISKNGRLSKKEIKTFGTNTNQIFEFTEWIKSLGCECVAMESTASYWKPLYNILEAEGIKTIVVNARHIKAVPGRKTDVKDAEWIADLLRHGLLKASYIPNKEQRELREFVRYRRSIIQEKTREVNRIHKVLEGANIKLGTVISDIMGNNGRVILDGLINSEKSPHELANLTDNRLKSSKKEIEEAITGLVGTHQKVMLQSQYEHIIFLEKQIEKLSLEIEKRMNAEQNIIEMLDEIPGIGRLSAENILAEIGTDMSRFPSEKHISSWAGLSPGNNESAGKKKSSKTTKGNKFLKASLIESGKSAKKGKNTYFHTQYQNLRKRMSANKANVAIAHSILVIIYYMIKNNVRYKELGSNHFDECKKERILNMSIKRLEKLGYKVAVEKTAS